MRGDSMQKRWPLLLCGLALLLHARDAGAQDTPELTVVQVAHATRLAANPRGLSLHIRPRDRRLRFAQGEVITLDLEFEDTSSRRYPFEVIAYDRSGRLGIDRLIVAPAAGVEDPLQDYYRAMGFGFLGGGVSAPPAPLDGSRTLSLDLNEWVRFARPGNYVVYVESRRFLDPEAAAARRHEPVLVVSNLVSLSITTPPPGAPSPSTLSARALRFADSPAAARELARRLVELSEPASRVGTEGFDLQFGLLGTPHRAEALAVLRGSLATMSRAVSEAVPRTMAFLDVMIEVPRKADEGDATAAESADRVRERMARHACRLAFWQREALAAGLRGGRDDAARAIVAFSNDAPSHCPALHPIDVARVLPPVFVELPPMEQRLMLSYRWGQVAGPAMLPVLRQLVSVDRPADLEVRNIALVRLGELAPAEAARVSRNDVVSGRLLFSARSLRVQPQDAPAMTRALAAHFARARDAATPLSDLQDGQELDARGLLPAFARLGTETELATLSEWPQAERASCAARATVLAYALRVDRSRGVQMLRDALDDGRSRCRENLLETLARSWPQHVSQSMAVAALWHESRAVAASAARALARIGTDRARESLWKRLHEWHAQWEGREEDLRLVTPHVDDPVSQELALAHALREALLRGRGWLTTAEDRLRVRESCVTMACREEFSPFRAGPPVRLTVVEVEEWTGETLYRIETHVFHSMAGAIDRLTLYPKTVAIAWRPAAATHQPERRRCTTPWPRLPGGAASTCCRSHRRQRRRSITKSALTEARRARSRLHTGRWGPVETLSTTYPNAGAVSERIRWVNDHHAAWRHAVDDFSRLAVTMVDRDRRQSHRRPGNHIDSPVRTAAEQRTGRHL